MLRRLNRIRDGQAGNVKLGVAAGVVLALVIAPLAIAQTTGLIGGKRNPRSGSFSTETQVIASNSSWGMRYSNRAVGGGGGLRSAAAPRRAAPRRSTIRAHGRAMSRTASPSSSSPAVHSSARSPQGSG